MKASVDGRAGNLAAAQAQFEAISTRIDTLLPAQRDSAAAALAQAETEIAKATVFAGTNGTVKQFKLQVGDVVNPILRPAGILVPDGSGVGRFQAGFWSDRHAGAAPRDADGDHLRCQTADDHPDEDNRNTGGNRGRATETNGPTHRHS